MNSDEMYDVVKKIRSTRGTLAKKHILSMYPQMGKVLRTTYDPFVHFGIVVPPKWASSAQGEQTFSPETNKLLTGLASGTLSGARATRAVKAHLEDLSYASAQLLVLILNKSMDFGLAAKSINDVFPGLVPQHPIQLAKVFARGKCQFPCFGSPKLNGLRTIADPTSGAIQLLSRNGHQFTGLSQVQDELMHLYSRLPEAYKFDGEMMVDGEHFNEISGQIRSFSEADNAHYHIFDIPSMGHLPLYKRLDLLNWICSSAQNDYPHISFVSHETLTSYEAIDAAYERHIQDGYEGLMIKSENSLYEGERTWSWMKMKPVISADCRITGIYEGFGKYTGTLGGIIVDFNGVEVKVGGGMSDAQRRYWSEDPDSIIGRTAEVMFQEITPAGSMRHPRLKMLRGDK